MESIGEVPTYRHSQEDRRSNYDHEHEKTAGEAMKNTATKLAKLEQDIAKEKGKFILFGLFLREDSPDLWDILVSAPWITKNKDESIKYIAERINRVLEPEEVLKLSRIVIIEQDNAALSALQGAVHVEHGLAEIKDSNFFGLQIKHAYLITSLRQKGSENQK